MRSRKPIGCQVGWQVRCQVRCEADDRRQPVGEQARCDRAHEDRPGQDRHGAREDDRAEDAHRDEDGVRDVESAGRSRRRCGGGRRRRRGAHESASAESSGLPAWAWVLIGLGASRLWSLSLSSCASAVIAGRRPNDQGHRRPRPPTRRANLRPQTTMLRPDASRHRRRRSRAEPRLTLSSLRPAARA